MLTPSLEGLRAKSFICAMVEAPIAFTIAVADVPTLVALDMAAKAIACGGTENLASAKVDSPMSASGHDVYLISMYSAVWGVPLTSVSILYHKAIGIW